MSLTEITREHMNEILSKAEEDHSNFDIFTYTNNTAIYPGAGSGAIAALAYVGLGLGEAGEVQNNIKKILRDTEAQNTSEVPEKIKDNVFKELGDLYWYWLRCCIEFDFDPYEVIFSNYVKLEKRRKNNTISGSGDNR